VLAAADSDHLVQAALDAVTIIESARVAPDKVRSFRFAAEYTRTLVSLSRRRTRIDPTGTTVHGEAAAVPDWARSRLLDAFAAAAALHPGIAVENRLWVARDRLARTDGLQ
jgi:hypothetical protein